MKARLLPLDGKYYGTKVEITDDRFNQYEIVLWNNGSYEPSDRELEGVCTIEQWRKNELLPTEDRDWFPNGIPAKEAIEICDSHFESRETHELATRLVEMINTYNVSNGGAGALA